VLNINTFWGIFLQGLFSGLIGLVVLVVTLKLLENEEINEIFSTFKQRFNLGKYWF
jgi:hypothetical protein